MNLNHIHAFTSAMQRKDLEGMLLHVAEDIVLNTPLAGDPVKGKAAIRRVVSGLLSVVDSFDFREIMQGSEHVSTFFRITVGPNTLDGMDYWRLDDVGLIQEMTVLWRPLSAVLAVQNAVAAA